MSSSAELRHSETVQRYYELVDRDAVDELLKLFHDDITYHRMGTPLITGRAALERFYRSERLIAHGAHQIEALLANDDWVAVRGRFVGRTRAEDDVALDWTDWHHFRDGVIDYRQSLFPGQTI